MSDADFKVLSNFHHDSRTFTQGLEFHNGLLYESGGLYGQSSLQIIHPDSGALIKRTFLDKKYFGTSHRDFLLYAKYTFRRRNYSGK